LTTLILDTNIVSALMREPRTHVVVTFLDTHDPTDIHTTAITIFEIRQGIRFLPEGLRRRTLDLAFSAFVAGIIEHRVLPFDDAAAEAAAELIATRRRLGRPIAFNDTFIAGIALTRKASVVTRNVRDFDDCGLDIINPWAAP
jgi:toxin FitB